MNSISYDDLLNDDELMVQHEAKLRLTRDKAFMKSEREEARAIAELDELIANIDNWWKDVA